MAVSRAATEAALRRSRIEAEIQHDLDTEKLMKDTALRRSRAQAEVSAEQAALRRSRLEEEVNA